MPRKPEFTAAHLVHMRFSFSLPMDLLYGLDSLLFTEILGRLPLPANKSNLIYLKMFLRKILKFAFFHFMRSA